MRKLAVAKSADLAAVLAQIESERDKELQLFFPVHASFFHEPEAFRMLRANAEHRGKKIIVVTPDQNAQGVALRVGLTVYNERGQDLTTGSVRRERGRSVVSDIGHEAEAPLTAEGSPTRKPAPSEESLEEEFLKIPAPPSELSKLPGKLFAAVGSMKPASFSWLWKRMPVMLGVITLLVAGAVALVALPKAEVRITPRSEEITLSFPLRVSKEALEGERTIPGQVVEVAETVSRSYPASGKEVINEKARGVLTIYNAYSTAPQTLVASTRFVSQEGKLFRSVETVVVPGASGSGDTLTPSSIDAQVIAAEAGGEYNIGPSTFSIPGFQGTPKYTAFYGKSTAGMTGGFKGESPVVTEEDRALAEEAVAKLTEEALAAKFTATLPAGFMSLPDAKTSNIVLELSHTEGEKQFTMTGSGTLLAVLFREDDVKSELEEGLASRLKKEAQLLEGTETFRYKMEHIDLEEGILDLTVTVEAKVAWVVDTDAIRSALLGRNEREIRAYIAGNEAVARVDVDFWPLWVQEAPQDPSRVFVSVRIQ